VGIDNQKSQKYAIISVPGAVVQLGERLLCTQEVGGSNPPGSTKAPDYAQKTPSTSRKTSGSANSDPLSINFATFVEGVALSRIGIRGNRLSLSKEALKMTLEEAVRIYTICVRAENKSERTVDWVKGAAGRLAFFIGRVDINLGSITADLVRRFIISLDEQPAYAGHPFNKQLKRPVSPETKSCYIRGLKALFSRLVQEGYIPKNPLARIKTPKVPARVPTILDEKELSKFFKVIDKSTASGFRDYAMCLTFLDTGMRASELSGLTTGDVDLENGYFRIIGKGQKERFVPMGYKLTKVLLKYITSYRYRETGSISFFITEAGNPLNRNRIAKIVRDYARKAGITDKRIHPHVFRATKAVLFLRHGGDVFSLQKCLGHATLTMTRRYSAIVDADVKSAHLKYGVVDRLKI
jgi:integrase/recombinase XerD